MTQTVLKYHASPVSKTFKNFHVLTSSDMKAIWESCHKSRLSEKRKDFPSLLTRSEVGKASETNLLFGKNYKLRYVFNIKWLNWL